MPDWGTRRWYEDRYIAWFFRSSLLAALVAAAGLVLTAAALAHLHENVLSVQPHLTHWPAAPTPAPAPTLPPAATPPALGPGT